MVFSSSIFLFLFLPLTLLVYYNPFVKSIAFRNLVLLLASLGFYAWGEPVFILLMLFSIAVTFALGTQLSRKESKSDRKRILILGIVWHIAILFVFKYLSFLLTQLVGLLNLGKEPVTIPLPIGISFFTFQMMSYLFDVYYHKAEGQRNILYVGLYVSFFPQLIAGPIVRYDQIADQLGNRQTTHCDLTYGMGRFLSGLVKKVLLANYLAVVADNIFDIHAFEGCAVLTAWLGAVAYMLQIYFDFSGYSDMAIGLGRMFGFSFPENFNYPYVAASVTDFWRRWHISLSGWFRDYVYIPLGGSRTSRSRWVRNLLIVWLLTGIWHGANWTFLVWGLIYFLLLLLEKTTHLVERLGAFSHVYTLFCICVAWVVFRTESISAAVHYLGLMFGIGAGAFSDSIFTAYAVGSLPILILAVVFSSPMLPALRKRLGEQHWYPLLGFLALVGFVLSLLTVVGESYNPFIYFNF